MKVISVILISSLLCVSAWGDWTTCEIGTDKNGNQIYESVDDDDKVSYFCALPGGETYSLGPIAVRQILKESLEIVVMDEEIEKLEARIKKLEEKNEKCKNFGCGDDWHSALCSFVPKPR